MEDVIIADSDQVIYNTELLTPYFERSGYNCVWTDNETKEWLLMLNDEGIVTNCSRNGGKNGWQLYSISRWSKEDGQKLKKYLETEFVEKKNDQIYWDDVVMFCYPEDFNLGIIPMKKNAVVEIDTIEELVNIDTSYKKYIEKEKK